MEKYCILFFQASHDMSLEKLEMMDAKDREATDREQKNQEFQEELEVELDAKDELVDLHFLIYHIFMFYIYSITQPGCFYND